MNTCVTCKRMYSLEKSFCSHDGRRLAPQVFLERNTAELPLSYLTRCLEQPALPAIFQADAGPAGIALRPDKLAYAFATFVSLLVLAYGGAFFTVVEMGGIR